ncbi:MAG: DUF2142 domain-containing protein [Clostridia bacterium]|nr:DUF2142 domain-containing protein [Clostridia bacterium]
MSPLGGSKYYDVKNSTPVLSGKTGQEIMLNDCKIEGDAYIAEGEDPYVVFDCSSAPIWAFTASFSAEKSDSAAYVYYDTGDGFNEKETYTIFIADNENHISYPMNKSIRYLRFDFRNKLKLEKVDFYNELIVVDAGAPSNGANKIIILTVSILLAGLLTFVEYKLKLLLKIFSAIKNNRKPILLFAAGLCGSALTVVAATLLFLRGKPFNLYLFIFFFAFFAIIFEAFFFRKTLIEKTERLFLAICLTLGFMMIFATPVGHVSWDDGIHYRYALSTTSSQTQYSRADAIVMKVSSLSRPGDSLSENIQRNIFLNGQDEYSAGELSFNLNIPHFCSGVTVKLLRYLGFSFFAAFVLGKIPNLLIYAFVCYFAIKKLNSGKMLLSVIALFPTCLFVASNYSYDYWVIAFSFLGVAYYYSEVQKPLKPISNKDTMIMCGAFLLAAIPKAIYLTLLALPLLMPKKKISDKKKYYLTCIATFVFLAILVLIKAKSSVSGGGDIRGGENVDPSAQLSGIISHPFAYAKTLAKFLTRYLSISAMKEYISCFAAVGIAKSAPVFICLIIALAILDRNENDIKTANLKEKSVALFVLIVTAAMMATVLYIDYTPVGLKTINGCQERYLLPLIFPVFYTLGSFEDYIKFGKKNRIFINLASFGLCSIGVLNDFYNMILIKML